MDFYCVILNIKKQTLNYKSIFFNDRNSISFCSLGNLKKLGVLSLRDNKLQYLPVEVGQCTALHVLDVSGNRYSFLNLFSPYP